MSDWRIQIPFRSRSDPLTGVADAAGELPTDERAIVRQLVLDELVGGSATTAGELLDKLEKASPPVRRKMLDDARSKAGFESATDADARARFELVNHAARLKAGHETRPLRLAFSESGGFIDVNEADDDAARARVEEQSRRALREAQHAERAVDAAAKRENDDARAARVRSEVPPGFPT